MEIVVLGVVVFLFFLWGRFRALEDNVTELRTRIDRAPLPPRPLSSTASSTADAAPVEVMPLTPGGIPPASPLPPASAIPPSSLLTAGIPAYTPPDEIRVAFEREQEKIRAEQQESRAAASMVRQQKTDAADKSTQGSGFEFQFGKRLPVWIGGISLALAGFYLVKYSIEQGLLTEEVRIVLGFVFAALLIGGARYIREKNPTMADGARIAMSLAGAGIAALYATIYAATQMYHFFPPMVGFIGMAATTALAVVLSVRHGMPVAVLGMLGGFITPALITTDHPSAPMLFFYLFCLVAGLFTAFRKLGWWALSVPMAVLAFGWILVWNFSGNFSADDGLVMGLFILAVSGVIMVPSAQEDTKLGGKDRASIGTLNVFTAAAGVALMAFVTMRCDYGLLEWGMFGLLALGGIAMAFFRPAQFKYVPYLSLGTSLLMLLMWRHTADAEMAMVELGLAIVYTLPTFWLLRRWPSLTMAGVLSAASLGFYGVGYATIGKEIYPLLNIISGDVLHVWSAIAVLLALGFAWLTGDVFRNFAGDEKLRDRLLALFSLMTTAFASIALVIEVHQDWMAVAFAAETLAVCWVAWKIDIKALRRIAAILFGVFLLLILPQLLLLGSVTANSLTGVEWSPWHGLPPLADQPVFQLGIPMVLIGAAAFFLRLRGDDKLVELFEMTMVALGALMLYYLARHVFKVPGDVLFRKAGFMERGIITNIFFAAALLVVYTGRLYSRRALLWAGSFLFAMAMFRVFYFDLFISNPLWSRSQDVGATPLLNWLWLPYALPVAWLWLEEKPSLRMATLPRSLTGGLSLTLLFIFVTLQVRQFYHGRFLMEGATENAEVYTYSAVWLLLGAGLLFLGTLKQNKALRIASLGVMIVTVGKVFLYDVDELTGLYRVFSFMGLGLSLLALSWFYSRFVFKKDQ